MSREAMQLALDLITEPHPGIRTNLSDAMIYREKVKATIAALRAALAQANDDNHCGDSECDVCV